MKVIDQVLDEAMLKKAMAALDHVPWLTPEMRTVQQVKLALIAAYKGGWKDAVQQLIDEDLVPENYDTKEL